ncbi:MAG: kinase-like domain-containing protein [Benjaminiella poitrasii]|nr:MAG: kinase-like domain-containing protein [Benjaminiella poitrasii]
MENSHSSNSADESSNKNPRPPILVINNNTGHHSKRSISGMDILNGLKIITNSNDTSNNNNNNSSSATIPSSPVPYQFSNLEHYQFNQIDDFELKEPIGYGSSAIVYKAIYKPLNKPMALKMIDLDKFERNQIDELRRETALMALSKHTNVLRVYGSFVHGSKLYIVTPYLSGGSCLDIMKTRFPEGLEELSIATILRQTLEALLYLHKNGHIHRDVKAGNLLVDEDGTVLLADFGVSSSLMETGEKGMRKTFVGTPCWMAPEVMEQAEYDYKADIWSFGITAIELATGHAPFAKYPPLKVLMMTLSNDSPTLDRDHAFHKYSKSFKEMIDLCLLKDPSKRPNAEKLIQHPFFKQAKRKDYLARTILSELPPLEQRPRKKIPQKQVTITKVDEWNFDDDDDNDDDAVENEDSLSDQASNKKPANNTPKKHISFGDVIVRNNSLIHPTDDTPLSPSIIATTPPRKSRFVIEEAITRNESNMDSSSSVRSTSPMTDDDHTTSVEHNNSNNEIMKGRFYVNQPKVMAWNNITTNESSSDAHDFITQQQQQQQEMLSTTNDRKSRFEVSSTSSSSSSPMIYQPIPLSRDSSSYSSSSNKNSQTTPSAVMNEKKVNPEALEYLPESIINRKIIGRFELTGGSNSPAEVITPRGSISFSSQHYPQGNMNPTIDYPIYQIEELIKINESQRALLQEILKKTNQYQSTSTEQSTINSATMVHNEDLTSTIEHLEKLIQQTLLENTKLQKENESLRRELKELKELK